jgi:hypothetical protein
MMIGTSGRAAFALGRSSSPLIPGMLMSDRIRISERSPASAIALKGHGSGLRKFHREPASAEIAPELLAEQNLDIWLVIDPENEKVHACPPDFIRGAPVRGRTILTSVNSPGFVSTSIDPPWCLTMMS